MKSSTLFWGMAGVLLLCLCVSSVSAVCTQPCICNPGQGPTGTDYPTIQAAIDGATPGDTITVNGLAGPFNENININKQLTISGSLINYPEIRGSGSGPVIDITSDYVTIERFFVTNTVPYQGTGVSISSSNNQLTGLNVHDVHTGIVIAGDPVPYYNQIDSCAIDLTRTAIDLRGNASTVSHSTISRSNVSGVFIGDQLDSMNQGVNVIHGNTFLNNLPNPYYSTPHALALGSPYNTIDGNDFTDNYLGIVTYPYPSGPGFNGDYNIIYNNKFVRSGVNNMDGGTNAFNTTKTLLTPDTNIIGGSYLGGNYWADDHPDQDFSLTCTNGGDGICTAAFTDSGFDIVDNFPLTDNPPPPPSSCTLILDTIVTLPGTWLMDFDTGTLADDTTTDIWWEQMTETTRQMVPERGATIVNLGIMDDTAYTAITGDQLTGYTYSTTPIRGDDDPPYNQAIVGDVFGVHTNNGNFAKVKILSKLPYAPPPGPANDVDLHLVVYSCAGSGSIDVSSTPEGAEIFLDGYDTLQTTPYTFIGVSTGPHTVKLTKTDYFDAQRSVTVHSGETASVFIKMDAIPPPVILPPHVVAAVKRAQTTELNDDTSGGDTVSALPTLVSTPEIVQSGILPSKTFTSCFDCAVVAVDFGGQLANGDHPVKYIAYDTSTDPPTVIETYDGFSLPTNLQFILATGEKPSPGVVYQPIDPTVWSACTQNCENNYALLISGGIDQENNHRRYWNDIAFMYNTLIEYNYKPSHIIVLMSDGTDTSDLTGKDRHILNTGDSALDYDSSPLDLTADGVPETIGDATVTTIRTTLASLASGPNALPANANLTIFTTSHGGWDGVVGNNNATLYAWGGKDQYITDNEFVGYLDALTQVNSITMVMEQCYGGGFKDEFIDQFYANNPTSTQKRVLITAANGDESSWGNGFSEAWTTGIAGHIRTSGTIIDKNADTSTPKDERVSMQESYIYPTTPIDSPRDQYATIIQGIIDGKEHPQIYTSLNADPPTQFLNDCSLIETPSITQVSPLSSATWNKGSHQQISWTTTGLPVDAKVKVTLTRSGSEVMTIIDSVDARVQSIPWDVPTTTPPSTGTSYRIKVDSISPAPAASGTSKSTFSIGLKPATNTGTVTLTTVPPEVEVFWEGQNVAHQTPYTRSNVAEGKYIVKVTNDSYYPYQATVTVIARQTATPTWTLQLKPTDSTGNCLDPTNDGGLFIDADQSDAAIWIGEHGGTPPTHPDGLDTPSTIHLKEGFYDVYVTKDGFETADPITVQVEHPYKNRAPEDVYFTLKELDTVTPDNVKIVPQTLNLGSNGVFVAFVTLPSEYKAADVIDAKVTCEGARAIKIFRCKQFPQSFAAVFNRQELNLATIPSSGKKATVTLTVQGAIWNPDGNLLFSGSDKITIINQKTSAKEAINDALKTTGDQCFKQFKPKEITK